MISSELRDLICSDLDQRAEEYITVSKGLHALAEPSGEEYRSRDLLSDLLESHGFNVERGLPGHPTAFHAVYGTGTRHIGYLCEYDALAGLQQDDVPYKCGNGGYGHGCGHNLLGTGSAAAAIALKEMIDAKHLDATVVVYGTPAEETTGDKVSMLRDGCFTDMDVALGWHPCDHIDCRMVKQKAVITFTAEFHGITAHACTCPEDGRSALDAAELMSVGCNYLREHVDRDSYIHYCYINGGERPNIVPDYAKVQYTVRAYTFEQCMKLYERVQNVAKGAAMMTDTTVAFEINATYKDTRVNYSLCNLAHDCMTAVKAPEYTQEEIDFAHTIVKEMGITRPHAGELPTKIPEVPHRIIKENGSSDIADISQVMPTINLNTTTQGYLTPNHSWGVTVQAMHSVGFKGMLFAAKTLALMGAELITDPKQFEAVMDDYRNPDKNIETDI